MKISDLVEFNPKTSIQKGEELPFIEMAALPTHGRDVISFEYRPAKSSGSKFQNGDTLLARITPCLENGKGALLKNLPGGGKGCGSTEFIVMRPHQAEDTDFVYYLSRLPEFREFAIQQMTGTSGRQRVNWQSIADFEIAPLNRSDRQACGALFASLDNKIELNQRMNETLEAAARAVFKDWFVDFGPVRAKAEGREPYLPPELWALFPDALDDEGKPEGWSPSNLDDRIEILDSKRVPLSAREREQYKGPYPYYGAAGIMDHVDGFLFEGIHVLLGEDGSVTKPDGKPFTQYAWGQFWVNNHAHVLKGKDISNEMLLCFLQSLDIAPYVTGAVQPKLNQKNLKSIPFPAAGDDVILVFDTLAETLFKGVRFNSDQSQNFSQIRDALLPKLMSGEINLRDAESAAAKAL